MSVIKLCKSSRAITKEDIKDAYSYFAYHKQLTNYRIFDIGSIVSNKITTNDIPKFLMDFIGTRGKVLGIINYLNGIPLYIKFKTLGEKDFITYGVKRAIPYGLFGINDGKYNPSCPIVVVEGEKDRDALSLVYPYVIAVGGSGIGSARREVLATVTNRIILALDNDDTGIKNYYKEKRYLEEKGIQVDRLIHPDNFKDTGELADLLYKGEEDDYVFYSSYYKNLIQSII